MNTTNAPARILSDGRSMFFKLPVGLRKSKKVTDVVIAQALQAKRIFLEKITKHDAKGSLVRMSSHPFTTLINNNLLLHESKS